MIRTFAPGKLFIAGEYAAIETGHTSILVAVDKFIRVTLEIVSNKNSLDQVDNPQQYIKEAVKIVEEYAREQGKEIGPYYIKVDSQLETDEGVKYGLGSSAAVTVATIKALCIYYGFKISNEILFKLAALANLAVKSTSSCGDIAASVYHGWVAYTTFDKNWVLEQRKKVSLTQLLNMEWMHLSIEKLIPPKDLILLVGWTGKPISTAKMVDDFNNKIIHHGDIYINFLEKSQYCINNMIKAFRGNDTVEIQKQIKINREILLNLSRKIDMVIETQLLSKLCQIAIKHNGSPKPSGAGGGDCGIAIFRDTSNLNKVMAEWSKKGIINLPLNVYDI